MNTKHLKNIFKTAQIIFLSVILFVSLFSFVGAETKDYTVLAPLPGTTSCGPNGGTNCTTNLSTYLPNLFNLFIGVGAVAAFVVITIFGFEYMLTDSLMSKQRAKEWVTNALWGLGLIIFAYVILYTINPALLKGSLNVSSPTIAVGEGTVVGSTPFANPCADPNSASCASDKQTRTALTNNTGITVAKACNGTQTSGCTDLNGVTQPAIQGTLAIQQACRCVQITGATEHQPGNAIDMASNGTLNNYITGSPTITTPPTQPITKVINGQTVKFTYEAKGQQSTLATGGTVTAIGNHWHVSF